MVRCVALLLVLLVALGICAAVGGFSGLGVVWILPLCLLGSAVGLIALAFLILWFLSAIVDMEKPQEKDNKFYRIVVSTAADLALWIVCARVHTKGLEKTPKDGRFLLVCNHINDLDPVTLLAYFKKSQLAFISKRENTTMFMVGKFMHKLMCQLIMSANRSLNNLWEKRHK
jgi:1-acyl-sn-glycerol-3-phosphate acyltransferase